MKFELGEIVFALHFDKHRQAAVYLEECIIVGLRAKLSLNLNGHYEHAKDLKEHFFGTEAQLFPISFEADKGYFLFEEDDFYTHPEERIFKTKQEALLYLHGIVSEIAK